MNRQPCHNTSMKQTVMIEGSAARANFVKAMGKLLTVPKAELLRREAEYKKIADANPNKRGPKKAKLTPIVE